MRHGAPLQGDLEGKPGRDPEVHHQGADHALSPPRQTAGPRRIILLAVLSLHAACSGPSTGPGGRAAKPVPREGTILYHEPARSEGLSKRKSPAKTLIFTTGDETLASDGAFVTYSGRIGENADATSVAREILRTPATMARVLSQEAFAELWNRLASAGIFELPAYRGKDPPGDSDYFLFGSGGERTIFTRPSFEATPRPDDPAVKDLERWRNAKLVLFEVLNAR